MTTIAPYVALGDSFAAGIGSQTRGDRVRRVGGYPVLVARELGLDLAYQATRDATVEDVLADQVEAVGPETRLVTLTVGAGDADLGMVLRACTPGRDTASAAATATRAAAVHVPARLGTLLVEIRERSPKARLVVAGYPHLAPPHGGRVVSPEQSRALRDWVDDLDDLIEAVVTGQGATVIDMRTTADDDTGRLVHGWTLPLQHAFHPTADGHRRYADAILAAVTSSGHPIPRSPLRPGMAVPGVMSGPQRPGSGSSVSALGLLAQGRTLTASVRRRSGRR